MHMDFQSPKTRPRVARPASAFFEPAFYSRILDGCKPGQMHMISKADTIRYLATETDPEHSDVEGFIRAGCQTKREVWSDGYIILLFKNQSSGLL